MVVKMSHAEMEEPAFRQVQIKISPVSVELATWEVAALNVGITAAERDVE